MKKKLIIALGIALTSAFIITGVILPNDPQPPRPQVVFQLLNQ